MAAYSFVKKRLKLDLFTVNGSAFAKLCFKLQYANFARKFT